MYKVSAVLNSVPARGYYTVIKKIVKASVCGVVWCFVNYM